MRSTRNKEYIEELRAYIIDCIKYDDAPTDSPADQFKTMVHDALIPWTRGNVRRNLSIYGWRQFIDFEQANLDFDYETYKQNEMLLEYTGKTFEQTVKEALK